MALILRATKGAALTHPELDANFTFLDDKIDALPLLTRIKTVAGLAADFELADAEKYHRFTNIAAKEVTLEANATIAFPFTAEAATTSIAGINAGAGLLTITPAVGVTINKKASLTLTVAQWGSFVLTKVGVDEWDIAGDLEPV